MNEIQQHFAPTLWTTIPMPNLEAFRVVLHADHLLALTQAVAAERKKGEAWKRLAAAEKNLHQDAYGIAYRGEFSKDLQAHMDEHQAAEQALRELGEL